MSQIRTTSLALGLLLSMFMFSLSGCGDTNSQVTFGSDSGKHPASWLPSGHTTAAKANFESCTECHGSDFSGGISQVACTQCHLGNEEAVHPLGWGQFAYALHKPYVQQNGTTRCSTVDCHGVNLEGVAGSGPSCTSCHMGGAGSVHPLSWNADITLHGGFVGGNGTSACRNVVCHGANLQGVFLSGPACNACHNF